MASALCSAEDCNRLVFEAVNEISASKFELVKRTFSPIEVMTSLVQLNEKGETPLVIAMKGESVSLIDELVEYLRLRIYYQDEGAETREMCLIAIDQLFHHQIPIMEVLEYLTKQRSPNVLPWIDFFAQVVFKSTFLSRQDKIIALELIGASLGNCYCYWGQDQIYYPAMFRCWREAMTLRYSPADDEPVLLPKIPHVGVSSVASSVVFGSAVEVMSMEELNLLQEHYERDVVDVIVRRRCKELMRRQCLLVIRRTCSQANNRHPYLYLQSLYLFGTGKIHDYPGENIVLCPVNSRIAINTFLLILEQMTEFDPKLLPHQSCEIFFKSLCLASHFLAFMTMELPGSPGREELSYANLLALTKFIGTNAKLFPNPAMWFSLSNFGYYSDYQDIIETMFSGSGMYYSWKDYVDVVDYDVFAECISDLVLVLEDISPQLNNQKVQKIEEHISNYIRNYSVERTDTVLHAGVRGLLKSKSIMVFFEGNLKLKPIKLILELGANPNNIDEKGRTPLHYLAEIDAVYRDENFLIFKALVDAGAHLDMAADNDETVLDILKRSLIRLKDITFKQKNAAADAYFSSLINTVSPLFCYCARVIRRHGIRFDEDRLPFHLQTIVARHSHR